MAKKAPTRKPIDVETLWKLKRPSGLTVSPDFTHACVTVSEYDMEENQAKASLWLLSLDGESTKALTHCGERDGAPTWSPDGSTIAFVAKRHVAGKADEAAQLYLIDPAGGEARRLTRNGGGLAQMVSR
jgi:Tol biopolymer transport system component